MVTAIARGFSTSEVNAGMGKIVAAPTAGGAGILPGSLSWIQDKYNFTDDEIPFEIPQGWEWCRIREVSQSYIGLTYSPSEVSSMQTTLPSANFS